MFMCAWQRNGSNFKVVGCFTNKYVFKMTVAAES